MKTPPSLISEELENEDPIKPASEPGDPNDNIWYDDYTDSSLALSNISNSKFIDNNDVVNIDELQRFKINDGGKLLNTEENMDKLDMLRKKLKENVGGKTEVVNDSMLLSLGDREFAVVVKGYLLLKTDSIEKLRVALSNLISKDKNLKYEDLNIIYKVSIDEIFQ